MPSRHLFCATALLLAALGCNADSPTEPIVTSTPEAAPELAATSASNTWTMRRDMPSTTRFNVATATLKTAAGHSILYAMGGVTANGGSLSRVQAYDVATNTWTWKAPLPDALKAPNGAVVIKGKIYIAGGITSGEKGYNFDLFVYDPRTNRWTTRQQMPTAGHSGFTGVIDHKLYMVTHCRDFDNCSFPGRWLLRYDPVTDTWTELATPPRDVSGGVGGVIGNKFYVGARFNQPEVLDVYDAANNTWTQRTTNLAVRSAAASTVMQGKLYMIGGRRQNADGTLTSVRATSVYDPATNRWTNVAPMPSTRAGMAAAKVFLNGQPRIELVGGPTPGNNLQYIP